MRYSGLSRSSSAQWYAPACPPYPWCGLTRLNAPQVYRQNQEVVCQLQQADMATEFQKWRCIVEEFQSHHMSLSGGCELDETLSQKRAALRGTAGVHREDEAPCKQQRLDSTSRSDSGAAISAEASGTSALPPDWSWPPYLSEEETEHLRLFEQAPFFGGNNELGRDGFLSYLKRSDGMTAPIAHHVATLAAPRLLSTRAPSRAPVDREAFLRSRYLKQGWEEGRMLPTVFPEHAFGAAGLAHGVPCWQMVLRCSGCSADSPLTYDVFAFMCGMQTPYARSCIGDRGQALSLLQVSPVSADCIQEVEAVPEVCTCSCSVRAQQKACAAWV